MMLTANGFAQNEIELTPVQIQQKIDSINQSFTYKHGKVILGDNIATIEVPNGYKFLDALQTATVLTDLWGNPPSTSLGMLFPEDIGPISDDFTFAIEISYENEGHIKDDDAENIDYDDLLKNIKKDSKSENKERKKLGYPTVEMVGWAAKPYYDKAAKKLHWAKELKFEDAEINTLNYNIRVLGRKGFLNLNAIGDITVLPKFNNDVQKILNSVSFNEGNRYADFSPGIDKVAAYGIGGLIAGKVLAKAGLFALVLKFGKVIALAIAGLFAAFKNKIFGKKEEKDV